MKFILMVCLALAAICFRTITDKETPDWTGTTQGQVYQDSAFLHFQNCMRLSEKAQREMDSIYNTKQWKE